MTVALVAIVKNERHVLPRLFDSVKDICDLAIISDTGSTDGTQDWLLQEAPIPVLLYEEPWQNMEHNRTLVMQHAHDMADWLLLLDADMTVEGELPELDPVVDSYMLELPSGDMSFWVSRLVSGRVPWCYQGYGHEYIAPVPGSARIPRGRRKLPGLKVIHHADGGNRVDKYERSTEALLQDLKDHPERRNRTLFYLANNYRDMGKKAEAIRYYMERVEAGGWEEEVYLSMVRLGQLTLDPEWFWKAYKYRPTRREALAYLGRFTSTIPPSDDILFVDNRVVLSPQPPPWNREGYGTYLPALVHALSLNSGPVLEIGAGDWSTPFLHQVCFERSLVTVEPNAAWRGRYAAFEQDSWHEFYSSLEDIPEQHWGVVLVDGTFSNRAQALEHLDAEVFVVHDTQPEVIGDYPGMAEALANFKYRQDWRQMKPHTAIVSNTREV